MMRSRISRILASTVAALSFLPGSRASAQAPAMLWGAGSMSQPGAAWLLTATPSTSPEAAAAALAARPAGRRGLLMAGFADDLGSHDSLTVRTLSRASTVPSPWIVRGAGVAADRVRRWVDRLAAAGGRPDLVVFDCGAQLGAERYAASWAAINADPRSAPMKASLRSPVLSAALARSAAFAARWDTLAGTRIDVALAGAVGTQLMARFPAAAVALRRKFHSSAPGSGLQMRFGTHDFVRAGASGSPAGFDALYAELSGPAATSAAGRPAVVALPVPGAGTTPSESADRLQWWRELAFHSALRNGGWIMVGPEGLGAASAAAVAAAAAELSARTPSAAPSNAPAPASVGAGIACSVASGNGRLIARISVAPTVGTVSVTVSDGRSFGVPIAAGSHGAWFEAPAGTGIASVQVPAPPPSAWTVLREDMGSAIQVAGSPGVAYMLVSQYEIDPGIAETGIADPAKAVACVERMLAAGRGSEWGVLDFEDPFDAIWAAGTADPRWQPAIDSLVATIRALKQRFPGIRWTYYGLPRVRYWLPDGEWGQLTQAQRERHYAAFTDVIAPLMREMDFFNPGVYDVYERAMGMPTTATPRVEAEAWWRRANVEAIAWWFGQRGLPTPPVIPMVSPWFQDGGIASVRRPIPREEFLEEQVRPLVEAGASGIAIWGGMGYMIYVAQWPTDHPSQPFMQLRSQLRDRFARDYLGGVDPAAVEWTSPATGSRLADQVGQTLSSALGACESARP